jgi:hypothetical protein
VPGLAHAKEAVETLKNITQTALPLPDEEKASSWRTFATLLEQKAEKKAEGGSVLGGVGLSVVTALRAAAKAANETAAKLEKETTRG